MIDGTKVNHCLPRIAACHGVPVLCAVPAHDRAPEHVVRPRKHRHRACRSNKVAPRRSFCVSTRCSTAATQLSGGQRQRVAIGRAIVREPRIFLFDEPLSNLDAELRVSMRGEITSLHERLAATMVYVTHDQVEAMTMADKIVVLRAGRIEQVGTPLDLYNKPANKFVAGFIGSPQMNFVPVSVASVAGADLSLRLPGGGTVVVSRPGATVTPGRHWFSAFVRSTCESRRRAPGTMPIRVEQVEHLGGHSLLYGAGDVDGARATAHVDGQTTVRAGATVVVALPPALPPVPTTAGLAV
jgi:multiple sugar transport system ATP-binding protein